MGEFIITSCEDEHFNSGAREIRVQSSSNSVDFTCGSRGHPLQMAIIYETKE